MAVGCDTREQGKRKNAFKGMWQADGLVPPLGGACCLESERMPPVRDILDPVTMKGESMPVKLPLTKSERQTLRRLGIRLGESVGHRVDPCVEDVFRCAVAQAQDRRFAHRDVSMVVVEGATWKIWCRMTLIITKKERAPSGFCF